MFGGKKNIKDQVLELLKKENTYLTASTIARELKCDPRKVKIILLELASGGIVKVVKLKQGSRIITYFRYINEKQ